MRIAYGEFSQIRSHILQSLPLYSCTFILSLDGSHQIRTDTQTSDETCTNPSMLDAYMHRVQYQGTFSNIMSMNIVQFVSKHTLSKNELVPRSNEVIIRTYPTYISDPKGNNYGLYCKYQLIKFKPWQLDPQNAWENLPECDDTFILMYRQFLNTDYAKKYITTFAEELHRAEQYESTQNTNNDYDEPEDTTQQ